MSYGINKQSVKVVSKIFKALINYRGSVDNFKKRSRNLLHTIGMERKINTIINLNKEKGIISYNTNSKTYFGTTVLVVPIKRRRRRCGK